MKNYTIDDWTFNRMDGLDLVVLLENDDDHFYAVNISTIDLIDHIKECRLNDLGSYVQDIDDYLIDCADYVIDDFIANYVDFDYIMKNGIRTEC